MDKVLDEELGGWGSSPTSITNFLCGVGQITATSVLWNFSVLLFPFPPFVLSICTASLFGRVPGTLSYSCLAPNKVEPQSWKKPLGANEIKVLKNPSLLSGVDYLSE